MAGSSFLMKAAALAAGTALLALAACASGPPRQPMGERTRAMLNANPSAVIAAELAFARMAREQGTWTAFRHYATSDALWPSPGWTNVQSSLRGRPDSAEPIVWGPDMVWMSCDGSFAASTGEANLPGGLHSRFLTIWQRQSNGDYRWVLDQGFDSEGGEIAPDMIAGKVAECPGPRRQPERPRVRRGEAWQTGASNDGTLRWQSVLRADCSREVTVEIAGRESMDRVFQQVASAPPEGGSCEA
jgi:hypothetical protein